MIRAILFDLDDTLYDEKQFIKGGFKAVSSYISEENNIHQEEIYQLLLDTLTEYGRENAFNITLNKLGLYKERLIPKLVEIYRTHKPNLSLYPEVITVLFKLKRQHYKLGLITDGNVTVQKNKVEALKIKNLFDCMIFSDEYGTDKQKPNSFPYKKAIQKLNVNANESMYVGDNPYKDFITAKKLGMHTVRILRGQYKNTILTKRFEADHQIKNLRELLDTVTKIVHVSK